MYNVEMILNLLSSPIYFYIAIAVVVLLIVWIIRLEVRIHHLLAGKSGKSLEDAIMETHKSIHELQEFQKDSVTYFMDVEKRLTRSIQSVETIRFNPFKGTGEGGNQSFSTTFINEKGDGVVISSLYSRDRVSIFSKPLNNFASTFELTPEEKETVSTAKINISR